jgi:hypothetical protein
MAGYEPADDRATATLDVLLQLLRSALEDDETYTDVGQTLAVVLPTGLAHPTELELRIAHPFATDMATLKRAAYDIARRNVAKSIAAELPSMVVGRTKIHYYTREDVVRWIRANPYYKDLDIPEETITITVMEYPEPAHMPLTSDQMNGIAFAIAGLEQHRRPTLTSSLTQRPVHIQDIVQHAPIYTAEIPLATERLKRPYTVELRGPDREFHSVFFVVPEFMQGVLSVAHWLKLPEAGHNTVWRNLSEFTREGTVELDM